MPFVTESRTLVPHLVPQRRRPLVPKSRRHPDLESVVGIQDIAVAAKVAVAATHRVVRTLADVAARGSELDDDVVEPGP